MRKFTLAVLALFVFIFSTNAQIKKGSIFLGGDVSGSSQKTKTGDMTTNKQNGVTISPVFGKAIKENLILGVNAIVGIYNNKSFPNNGKSKTESYGGGMFIRKYKNLGASSFYLFAQAGLGAAYHHYEAEGPYTGSAQQKIFTIGINAYPGLAYAVSKKLQLETGFNSLVSLNYSINKMESGTPATVSKTNGISFSSSLSNATNSLFLGIRVLLGK